MALRVVNGAISWSGATLQISNIADLRKFGKKYVRKIPLPHSEEDLANGGKFVAGTGAIYILHFFIDWEWAWYIHLISLAIIIGGSYLYFHLKNENDNSPTQEVRYHYFVCIEKNSGKKEYFGSENEQFINQLYENISMVMHDNKVGTSINMSIGEVNHFDNIEGSTIYNNSFNGA